MHPGTFPGASWVHTPNAGQTLKHGVLQNTVAIFIQKIVCQICHKENLDTKSDKSEKQPFGWTLAPADKFHHAYEAVRMVFQVSVAVPASCYSNSSIRISYC